MPKVSWNVSRFRADLNSTSLISDEDGSTGPASVHDDVLDAHPDYLPL